MELGSIYPIPNVLPLGLAVKKSPLALSLWNYKRSERPDERAAASADLRSFIDHRLPHVLGHLDEVDTVTFVPSRKSSGNTVEALLESTEWGHATWIEDTLEVLDRDVDTHVPDENRFVAHGVSGDHVLLIDDTFTRGATALSAARALYEDGASEVSIVVLGRHTDLDFVTDEYIGQVRERGARGEFCPECTTRLESVPSTAGTHEPSSDSQAWEAPEDEWERPASDWGEPNEWASEDPWAGDATQAEPTTDTQSGGPWGTSRPDGRTSPDPALIASPADDDSSRLSDSAALTMTVILSAPFAIIFILPIFLSNIGISLGFDRFGGLWGPAGLNGYVTFMIFALTAGGLNWLLTSIPKVAAIAVLGAAFVAVVALFLAPYVGSTGESTSSSQSNPSTGTQLLEIANEVARERGVDPVALGAVQNAIDTLCPAVADGLTMSQARSDLDNYSEQEGIPDDVASQILLMTELVIEHSDSLC